MSFYSIFHNNSVSIFNFGLAQCCIFCHCITLLTISKNEYSYLCKWVTSFIMACAAMLNPVSLSLQIAVGVNGPLVCRVEYKIRTLLFFTLLHYTIQCKALGQVQFTSHLLSLLPKFFLPFTFPYYYYYFISASHTTTFSSSKWLPRPSRRTCHVVLLCFQVPDKPITCRYSIG